MTQVLRVGTDCSGIEAPLQALRLLGVPYRHVFSSEIDKFCIQSIKANHEPELLFGDPEGPYPDGDITNRDTSTLPDIDLYVCGFPCQPFSAAGNRKGFEDHRGNVFWSCLEVIKVKQPKYFILENVKGLLHHDQGRTWDIIWNELENLNKYGYFVQWNILNTRDYGIPQNRERVYIIGLKEQKFCWPESIKMDNIELYVNWNIKGTELPDYIEKQIKKTPKNSIFINNSFRNHNHENANLYCYTLATTSRYWCIPCKRRMLPEEFMMLQGFDPKTFKQVVSKTQLVKQVGNSMSVNVLCALLANMIDI